MSKAPKTCGSHPPSQLLPKEGGGLMWEMPVATVITWSIEQDITPPWACYGSGKEVDEYLALCCIHPFPTSLQLLLVMVYISNIIRNIVIF